MQVGISQLIAPDLKMAEFFRQAAAAGYEVVELVMKREGELTPQTPEADLKRIVELSRQHKLPIVSMCHSHCTGNLLESGEEQQRSIAETEAGLRAAQALGARCTLHTLGRLNKDLFYDGAYRNGVASLKKLAKTAEKLDVAIAVEFVWNGFLFSPLEMKGFLGEVASRHVGFYFDPGNMAVFHFPQHWARILGKYIKMVHMKDWKGNALNGTWPALLQGNIDYAAVNRELRGAGYDGPLISEVGASEAAWDETARSIRKIMAM
jgi:L-ribulose-5-phosphate 3-epimerase